MRTADTAPLRLPSGKCRRAPVSGAACRLYQLRRLPDSRVAAAALHRLLLQAVWCSQVALNALAGHVVRGALGCEP
jgi:hypothetical protein